MQSAKKNKIIFSFLAAFIISHLLVNYFIYPDSPVVRASFQDAVNQTRFRLALFGYQVRYAIRELPKKIAIKPPDRQRLPEPWFFVPPDEWLVPTRPPLVYLPPTSSPNKPPSNGNPYLSPTPYISRPIRLPNRPVVTPLPTSVWQPTNIPQPTPTVTVPSGGAPSAAAQTLFDLINGERQRQGIGELRFDSRLNQAAQSYADVIGPIEECSHTHGSTIFERFAQAGYNSTGGGENITCGISGPQSAFQAWMNSAGHRSNMLNSNWRSAGLGFNSSNGGYWVLDLGAV